MAPIFSNVRLDGRQFGDLMASRIADIIVCVEGTLAMTTRLGHEVNERVHALRGNHGSRVPRMPRLTAGLASTLRSATPFALLAGEAVG